MNLKLPKRGSNWFLPFQNYQKVRNKKQPNWNYGILDIAKKENRQGKGLLTWFVAITDHSLDQVR